PSRPGAHTKNVRNHRAARAQLRAQVLLALSAFDVTHLTSVQEGVLRYAQSGFTRGVTAGRAERHLRCGKAIDQVAPKTGEKGERDRVEECVRGASPTNRAARRTSGRSVRAPGDADPRQEV